jgi:hypothetical protein
MLVNCFISTIRPIVIFTFGLISFSGFSQNNLLDCTAFNKYRKLSVTAKPMIYRKAKFIREYGDINITSHPTFVYNFSIDYRTKPEKPFSIITGLHLCNEPGANYSYKIKAEDLYFDENEQYDFISPAKSKRIAYSVALPLLIEYKRKVGEKAFFNVALGLRIFYIYGGLSLSHESWAWDEQISSYRIFFRLNAESPRNSAQASSYLTSGLYFTLDKLLIQVNLIYNKNFQKFLMGEYHFLDLRTTPPSGGKYVFSGDFYGLSINLFLPQRKP